MHQTNKLRTNPVSLLPLVQDPGHPAMDLSPTSEPTVEEGMATPMAPMTIHVIGEDEDPQEMLQALSVGSTILEWIGLQVGWKIWGKCEKCGP